MKLILILLLEISPSPTNKHTLKSGCGTRQHASFKFSNHLLSQHDYEKLIYSEPVQMLTCIFSFVTKLLA